MCVCVCYVESLIAFIHTLHKSYFDHLIRQLLLPFLSFVNHILILRLAIQSGSYTLPEFVLLHNTTPITIVITIFYFYGRSIRRRYIM